MSIADCEGEESGWGVLEGLPGDPMMWVLVFSELVAFGLFLGAFIVARAIRPAVFASGQTELDLALAGYNTIVLVTSGWAAAKGAASARADQGAANGFLKFEEVKHASSDHGAGHVEQRDLDVALVRKRFDHAGKHGIQGRDSR